MVQRGFCALLAGLALTLGCGDGGKTLEVEPGVQLWYRSLGSGSPAVIVPNASQHPELERLAGSHRVVLYDSRGRGRSSHVDESGRLGIEVDVEDLEALRDHLGLERVALLGASYYGGLVARYAMEHPERVERVIMVAPLPLRSVDNPSGGPDEAGDPARRRMDTLRGLGLNETQPERFCEEYYLASSEQLFFAPGVARVMNYDFCQLPNEWPDAFEVWVDRTFESLGRWDWSEEAVRLDLPVLIVHGIQDRVVRLAASRHWEQTLPRVRLTRIDECGHIPSVERPSPYFEAVETFLGGEWPPERLGEPQDDRANPANDDPTDTR